MRPRKFNTLVGFHLLLTVLGFALDLIPAVGRAVGMMSTAALNVVITAIKQVHNLAKTGWSIATPDSAPIQIDELAKELLGKTLMSSMPQPNSPKKSSCRPMLEAKTIPRLVSHSQDKAHFRGRVPIGQMLQPQMSKRSSPCCVLLHPS